MGLVTMTPPRTCLTCGKDAAIAYDERIDVSRISEFTYASRKAPELMHYEMRECRECHLLFTSRLPDAEALVKEYEQASFDAALESRMAATTYVRALAHVMHPQTSVLDVGCGDGEFLRACLTRGVREVQGIEPSVAAAERADESLRSAIFLGGYESFDTKLRYDLITLFQTIEHIADPVRFLREVRRFAKPGARLAIACHDYRAPVNRALGEKSPIFDIEHLQIFSQKSIALLLARAGLTNIEVKTYRNVYPLSYWVRLAPVPAAVKQSKLANSRLARNLHVALPVGNVMALGTFPG